MWDRLLEATGSVSKQIGSRFLDEGYNSDSDEEGLDTHVIKALKDYYTAKGNGIPTWLGGSGGSTRVVKPLREVPSESMDKSATAQSASQRTGKVSLKGIYEQAAERSSGQTTLRRGTSRTGTTVRDESSYVRHSEESDRPEKARIHNAATAGRPSTAAMSAGERFRENLKTRRTVSTNNANDNTEVSQSAKRNNVPSSRSRF